jgi:hypothetical protein
MEVRSGSGNHTNVASIHAGWVITLQIQGSSRFFYGFIVIQAGFIEKPMVLGDERGE